MKPYSCFFIVFFLCFNAFSQQKMETDLLVIGASTGGTAAGIQAARMGIQTCIVEPTTWMGGMLTAAGVSCTDGNHSLKSGIWQEFREALYQHYGKRNLNSGWVSETCFEPSVGDSIFKAWARKEKNLLVQYGWYFEKVLLRHQKVIGAKFINKEGRFLEVIAKLTIDATDLGDGFASAGVPFDLGMESASYSGESIAPGKYPVIQDLTWAAILKDYGKGADQTIPQPQGYDPKLYHCSCEDAPCDGLPWKGSAAKMLQYGRLPQGKYMLNWPAHGNDYVGNVVELPQLQREAALQAARNKTLGFVYFIQTQLGMKHLGLADEFPTADKLALMPYHREGRRMRGVVRLNVNQMIAPYQQPQALYRTGIAVGDYPVDHHHAQEKKAPGIEFPSVPSFNIPLGALIPEKIEGLIVCEKGISVSNIANGSTRLQPCVLLTGQAAGVLAALSLQQNIVVRNIEVRSVQKELLKNKCYLMPYVDVQPNDPSWEAIQRMGAAGILRGRLVPQGWANKTYFDPEQTVMWHELRANISDCFPEFLEEEDDETHPVTGEDLQKIATFFGKEGPLQNKVMTRKAIAVFLDQILPLQKIDLYGRTYN